MIIKTAMFLDLCDVLAVGFVGLDGNEMSLHK
jgi:hypothetical protein